MARLFFPPTATVAAIVFALRAELQLQSIFVQAAHLTLDDVVAAAISAAFLLWIKTEAKLAAVVAEIFILGVCLYDEYFFDHLTEPSSVFDERANRNVEVGAERSK